MSFVPGDSRCASVLQGFSSLVARCYAACWPQHKPPTAPPDATIGEPSLIPRSALFTGRRSTASRDTRWLPTSDSAAAARPIPRNIEGIRAGYNAVHRYATLLLVQARLTVNRIARIPVRRVMLLGLLCFCTCAVQSREGIGLWHRGGPQGTVEQFSARLRALCGDLLREDTR